MPPQGIQLDLRNPNIHLQPGVQMRVTGVCSIPGAATLQGTQKTLPDQCSQGQVTSPSKDGPGMHKADATADKGTSRQGPRDELPEKQESLWAATGHDGSPVDRGMRLSPKSSSPPGSWLQPAQAGSPTKVGVEATAAPRELEGEWIFGGTE